MRSKIAAAAPAQSDSTSELKKTNGIKIEIPKLPFKPFFVSKSEIGRRRASRHFCIIIASVLTPIVISASIGNQIFDKNNSSINWGYVILLLLCVLFFCFGIYLSIRFFNGVQSIEIGYDPENDTKLLIVHKKCLPLHCICCPCIKYIYTRNKIKDIIDQSSITSIVCANMRSQSDGSNKHLYIIELQTQQKEFNCRIEETREKGKATRIVNEINKSLNKHEKYFFESMVDYA